MRLLAVSAIVMVSATGCSFIIPPVPESVLQGTWELTGDLVPSDVGDFLITFDRDGRISRITYKYNSATIIIDSSSFIRTSSNVDGNDVSISASWGSGSTLFFEGTMNSAQTKIEGTSSLRIVISPSISIDIPTGAAELTRQ